MELLLLIGAGVVIWLVMQANSGKAVLEKDIRELSTQDVVKFLALCLQQRTMMLGRTNMQGATQRLYALSDRADDLLAALLQRYQVKFEIVPTTTGDQFKVSGSQNVGALGTMMADVTQFAGPHGFTHVGDYLRTKLTVDNAG